MQHVHWSVVAILCSMLGFFPWVLLIFYKRLHKRIKSCNFCNLNPEFCNLHHEFNSSSKGLKAKKLGWMGYLIRGESLFAAAVHQYFSEWLAWKFQSTFQCTFITVILHQQSLRTICDTLLLTNSAVWTADIILWCTKVPVPNWFYSLVIGNNIILCSYCAQFAPPNLLFAHEIKSC